MSPTTVTISGQTIVSLNDDESCPISDTDLFKDFVKHELITEVLSSKFYLPNYDVDLVQSWIYQSKNYFEQNVLEKTNNYLNKSSIVIDIGANIGNHTLFWANETHVRKIYAFEPIPYTFDILKKNIQINHLTDRVKLYNIGLADKKCEGEIKTFCYQNIGGTKLKEKQSNTEWTVPLNTLDSFDINEEKIGIIKIDVEGMDYQVLAGAKETIKKYKPVILIESFPDSYEQSNSLLEELGYKQEYDFGSYEYAYVYKGKSDV